MQKAFRCNRDINISSRIKVSIDYCTVSIVSMCSGEWFKQRTDHCTEDIGNCVMLFRGIVR